MMYNTFYITSACRKRTFFFCFSVCLIRKRLWWNRWPTRLWSCSSSWRWPHTLSRTHEAASDSSSTKPRWVSASVGGGLTAVPSWGSNTAPSLQSKPVIRDQRCWTARYLFVESKVSKEKDTCCSAAQDSSGGGGCLCRMDKTFT